MIHFVRGRTFLWLVLVFSAFFFPGEVWALRVESPAFENQGKIPVQYTCDGKDVSPPLIWENPPEGTQSFALIADDPDSPIGTWVHWVLYSLPNGVGELQENLPEAESLPNGAKQGLSDFGKVGYGGPCPPPGKPHHYFFKVYALSAPLTLPPRATKTDLLVAMNGHILAQAELVGTYER